MARLRLTACWVVSLLWALPAWAGFDLPEYVFGLDGLDRAVAKARQHNRPLAFVLTDPSTHCGLCRDASLAAFRALRPAAVLVHVAPDEFARLPVKLRVTLTSARAGRFIPKVVVTDPTQREIVAVVPYAPEPRRSALLAQAIDLIRRHARRDAPRLALNLKPSRQPIQPVRPGAKRPVSPTPSRLESAQVESHPSDGPGSGGGQVIVLRWEGELTPPPDEILGDFFRAKQVPMQGRCRETGCRFEATAAVTTEAFLTSLQILLNQHYRVDRIHTQDNRLTAWLGLAEPDPPQPEP